MSPWGGNAESVNDREDPQRQEHWRWPWDGGSWESSSTPAKPPATPAPPPDRKPWVDPAPWEGGNPNRRRPLTGPDSLTGKGVSIAMKPENIKPHRSSGLYLRRVQAVMNRDGPYCHYCPAGPFTLEDFMAPDSKSAKASLDHKVPHSRGGPDGVPNRVIACCSCDTLKADTPYEEFVERMRSGGADA